MTSNKQDRLSFDTLKVEGTQGRNDYGFATLKQNGNLDYFVDHTEAAITDTEELQKTINHLLLLEGWSVYVKKIRIESHHRQQGYENLALECDHRGSFASSATKRSGLSKAIGCKWRLKLVKVVNETLACLPIGIYVKSYVTASHVESHHLAHNTVPSSFSECNLCAPVTASPPPSPSLPQFDVTEKTFWENALLLYSIGHTETQAFNKLKQNNHFATVIQHLNLSPSK